MRGNTSGKQPGIKVSLNAFNDPPFPVSPEVRGPGY